MNEHQEIHVLCRELIPMFDELDAEVQAIITQHTSECEECEEALSIINGIFAENEKPLPVMGGEPDLNTFKKLSLFKGIISIFFLVARVIVLGLISYNWVSNYHFETTTLLSAQLILFYFPLGVIINTINFLFFRNKWFWITLVLDILVLLFFDTLF